MTQHTPSNNRNVNNPNTNTAVLYSHKARGTHARVSRVRVTTVGKPPFPDKPMRNCPKCKESISSMKILNARVGRIEQLVNALAKTTRGLASSMSKREDRFSQHNLRFARLDLTRCSLQELQKLVVATTNVMAPSISNSNKSTSQKPTTLVKDADSDVKTIINPEAEEEVIHTEPMEDIKIYSEELSSHNHQEQTTETTETTESTETSPNKSISSLKCNNLRQDSGFCDITTPDGKLSDNAA